jgi:cytochrome bd-type quinol oxidase subunit 1
MASGVIESTADLRAEHDAVLSALSVRRSMLHLAHGAVSALVSGTFLAASAKLWWDFSEYDPEYYQTALAVCAVTACYSVVRFLIGRGHFKRERVELVRLRTLRRELGVDDPRVMLPN